MMLIKSFYLHQGRVLTLVDSMVMGLAVLVMMEYSVKLAIDTISLLPMPLMAILIKRYGDKLHYRFKSAQALFSSLNNQAQESLESSIRMIKSFGLEQQHASRFEKQFAKRRVDKICEWQSRCIVLRPHDFMAVGFANTCCGGRKLFCSQWHDDVGRVNQFCNVF